MASLVKGDDQSASGTLGDAFEWKYIQGLSVKEIAIRLELSPKAAESILTRARLAFWNGFSEVARELAGLGEQLAHG